MIQKLNSLRHHDGFMKYFKNTSWLMTEHVLKIVFYLSISIWIARYLGPKQFGLLSYAQSYAYIFTSIASMGIDEFVIKKLIQRNKNADTLIGTAFVIKLLGGIIVLSLVLFSFLFFEHGQNDTKAIILLTTSVSLIQSFDVITNFYRAKSLNKYLVIISIIMLLASNGIKIILLLNHASIIAFAFMVVFDATLMTIGLIFSYSVISGLSVFKWRFSSLVAKHLLKQSWVMVIGGVSIMIYMKVDQIMLKQMLNQAAVGEYAAALRISEGWYFVPSTIIAALYPAIVNAKKQGIDIYHNRTRSLFSLMSILSISIALIITLFSKHIIALLYGPKYMAASNILVIHVWAGIFVALGVAAGRWLVLEGLQVYVSINTIIGAIINVILNLILIRPIGVQGAAWATLISYAFSSYFCLFLFRKTRPLFTLITYSLIPINAKKNS